MRAKTILLGIIFFCPFYFWLSLPNPQSELFFAACSGPGNFLGTLPASIQRKPGNFKIKLLRPTGETSEFDCAPDSTILDAAEEAGIEDLPSSCRAGACASCTARVVEGKVDQTQQAFLNENQRAKGYCLTCVSYPVSDATIKTECESEIV